MNRLSLPWEQMMEWTTTIADLCLSMSRKSVLGPSSTDRHHVSEQVSSPLQLTCRTRSDLAPSGKPGSLIYIDFIRSQLEIELSPPTLPSSMRGCILFSISLEIFRRYGKLSVTGVNTAVMVREIFTPAWCFCSEFLTCHYLNKICLYLFMLFMSYRRSDKRITL